MRPRIPLSVEVKKVLSMLMVTLCAMLFATSSYFFWKMSAGAEKGYQLKENQLRREVLESDKRLLEQRVLEAQSLQNLQNSAVVEKMAPPEKTQYIIPRGPLTKRPLNKRTPL
ncbi:hypothetical protein HYV58_00220 [Candidatus Peregrinibacteria bacterium]|nr:hypothetical protein [Candidatus Peregrinibacteria bacterium]